MSDPQYVETVQDSFIKKPLRTVLMIDDAFPTFTDLCNDVATHAQRDRAAALYSGFRARDMLCDIENKIDKVESDHLRKSDLVILDYHLTPNSEDNSKSIQLLRQLATSHHFNTVIVYTAALDLDEVWLDVIASLSGGWSAVTASLDGEPKQHWETLNDHGKLPTPTSDAVKQYARRGVLKDIHPNTLQAAVDELTELEVPANHCSKIVEYLVAKELADRAGGYAGEPSGHAVGNYSNGTRWVQVGNAFVVVMQKNDGDEQTSETDTLMAALNEALLDWRPNVVQILISEIQNALELEGFAGSDTILRKSDMQAALLYNLLDDVGPIDLSKEVDLRVPVMSLVDKVVDSIRKRLSTHDELLKQTEKALIGELKSSGWTLDKWPQGGKLITGASSLARSAGTKNSNILFRLNHFMSTEKFRRAHLTTGTVFYHRAQDEYFVVATPDCDLVAGQARPMQTWATAINPLLAFVAVKLYPETVDKALASASQAEHLFLEIGDEQKAFKVTNGVGHQPSYEVIFAESEGRVRTELGKIVFDGARIVVNSPPKARVDPTMISAGATDGDIVEPAQEQIHIAENTAEVGDLPPANTLHARTVLEFDKFEIVEQLRGVNATHVLQLAGQHLSRIGLDFVSSPKS